MHICGDGDVRLAFEAGPTVLGLPVSDAVINDVGSLVRHLDADGLVGWGAIPTDRPVGESPEPLWRRLVTLWCELHAPRLRAVASAQPGDHHARVRARGPRPDPGRRALRLASELAERVATQSAAARLTAGA